MAKRSNDPHIVMQLNKKYFLFTITQQPPVGQGLLIIKDSRSHTTTHHSRQDSSGRVISSSQRPLPDNTQHSRQTRWDSNPQSQPASGHRPTPQTARSLGPANIGSMGKPAFTFTVHLAACKKWIPGTCSGVSSRRHPLSVNYGGSVQSSTLSCFLP